MGLNLQSDNTVLNRSHYMRNSSFDAAVFELKNRIISRGNLPHVSVDRQLELVDQLCEFSFGRYILERKGANGFWTDYLISYPVEKLTAGLNIENQPLVALEKFILKHSLLVLAHRERFRTYQKLIQERLKEGVRIASIPCGLMRDLITLDFSKISRFKLVGLDIDKESLDLADKFAKEKGLVNVEFFHQDAWQMEFEEEFDIITSSGLNVYESDSEKLLDLYHRLFAALKPGGSLIISVLSYPPGEAKATDWNIDAIPPEDLLMEKILYKDILDLHWRNFRSADELDREFKQVGFTEVFVYFDSNRVFPTIHAKKSS